MNGFEYILLILIIVLGIVIATIYKQREISGKGERLNITDLLPNWIFPNPNIKKKKGTRILSWNIHTGKGADGLIRENEMIDLINSIDPDIICLQEFIVPSHIRDVLFEKYYSITKCITPENINNIILSKYSIHDSMCLQLSDQRCCAKQVIEHKLGKISIYNVHLSVGNPDDRIDELKKLEETLVSDPNPKILIGDLNAPPNDPIHKILKNLKFKTKILGQTSIYGKQVDYIYTSKIPHTNQFKIKSNLSDHFPIVLDF
jgi:endonuclease/exonuclease/phosphatase family metal-dependent hydrolase